MSENDFREAGSVDADEARAGEERGPEDLEAPEADAAEQRAEVVDTEEQQSPEAPIEADPADRAEQERLVELGDDEYR